MNALEIKSLLPVLSDEDCQLFAENKTVDGKRIGFAGHYCEGSPYGRMLIRIIPSPIEDYYWYSKTNLDAEYEDHLKKPFNLRAISLLIMRDEPDDLFLTTEYYTPMDKDEWLNDVCGKQHKYQFLPDMTVEQYEALKSDIQNRGIMIPLEYDDEGNLLDGHHRLCACTELGITDFPKTVRQFKTEEEKRYHVRAVNAFRRHMTQEQRRAFIQEQLKDMPEKSERI